MMKTTIILLLLTSALLSSCSTTYTYPARDVTVKTTDGISKKYAILSVRGDSTIAVLDWEEVNVSPTPYSHVQVFKKDSIIRILREGKGGGIHSTIGGLAGAIAGGAIPFILFGLSDPSSLLLIQVVPITIILDIVVIGIAASLGAFVGSTIGNAFPPEHGT